MTDKQRNNQNKKTSQIYITIDHLKDGLYQLNVLKEDKVIKKINFKK